jgi:type I restriction enzyme, R subunit
MNKKSLTETDICTKYITPAIVSAGWELQKQIRQEVCFTAGRIFVRGQKTIRGEKKRADYILYYKPNIPIAIIEAKDNNHPIGAGMQQGLNYAEILDIPFVFSSNGDGFIEHDSTGKSETVEREISLDNFPSPEELWDRYRQWKQLTEEEEAIILQDYLVEQRGKIPRYYQEIAVNRTVEAVAKGQDRALLVMATGTGKTFVASQIIYRLYKAGRMKRILFLADRNVLIDQSMNNDFKHFKGIMTKVKHREVDKSYEIYMALYQSLTGGDEWKNVYKEFSPDFFDCIVIDECHRGSAPEDTQWREILEYFKGATHIGLTATPKETKEVSNIAYFGKPIYTYSLKQGIEDGFLAPYKVIRITLDKDVEGWRPTMGQKDKYDYDIPDHIYNMRDYDRDLVIDNRTKIVAFKVTEYLKNTDRYGKTIVFCQDIEHAERIRMALINYNQDMVAENSKYVLKITGDDDLGKKELDNFIDPASKYPVIATTSKLMTTGVDAQTCKLVVLDSNIQSMTEFKQIIGRGTRIREDYDKTYFAIMDFRMVTNLFADPDFDGEPVQIYEPSLDEEVNPPEEELDEKIEDIQKQVYIQDGPTRPRKYYVDNVEVNVLNERVQYYDKDGNLITESLKDFSKKSIQKKFSSMDEFLNKWNKSERKSFIIEELINQGILLHELKEEVGKDFDEFDLVCHIAFDQKPKTRKDRALKVKENDYFNKYGEKAKAVINALLDKYADEGIEEMEDMNVLSVNPFRQFGTPLEIVMSFGGRDSYLGAIREIEQELYAGV